MQKTKKRKRKELVDYKSPYVNLAVPVEEAPKIDRMYLEDCAKVGIKITFGSWVVAKLLRPLNDVKVVKMFFEVDHSKQVRTTTTRDTKNIAVVPLEEESHANADESD